MQDLNLARNPFANSRPVTRLGLLLLVIGLALAAVNIGLYWRHFSGEGKTRNRSQDLASRIAAEQDEIRSLEERIASLDVNDLNRRTRFINTEIDRRRFGWSRLFDQVAEVQPGAVRLVSLMPRFGEERGRARRRASRKASEGEVSLDLRGVARNGDALLALIDRLFAHSAFRNPDISRETKREDGTIDFVLGVLYLPKAATAPSPDPAETVESSSGDDAEAALEESR